MEGMKGREKAKVKKKMEGMKKGIVVGVLAAALLVSMVGIASADQQTWFLDNENHPDFGPKTPKVMEKVGEGTQSGSVTIPAGGEQIWLAKNDAECDVTFSGGFWIIRLKADVGWDIKNCTVEVGEFVPSNGGFNEFATTTVVSAQWSGDIVIVEIQADSETINIDNYLGLKIKNEDMVNAHTVTTDGCSSLSSPQSDPGYPVPEPPTIVLTGVGLLALVGYVGLRRRKNKK